jgi:hypothetical protein
MDASMVMALESMDPAELPEGAAEWLEKRRRGEGIPHGTVHVKITPLEEWYADGGRGLLRLAQSRKIVDQTGFVRQIDNRGRGMTPAQRAT